MHPPTQSIASAGRPAKSNDLPKLASPQKDYWRNGRVVECTGLENRRGSHLRGFESLFLRREKTRNESCGFLFSGNRRKFTFVRLQENKNQNRYRAVCRVFSLNGPPSGITEGNPKILKLPKCRDRLTNKDKKAALFIFNIVNLAPK